MAQGGSATRTMQDGIVDCEGGHYLKKCGIVQERRSLFEALWKIVASWKRNAARGVLSLKTIEANVTEA